MRNVEDILVEYLAPELAHTVSERITVALQEGLSSLLLNGAAATSAPAKLAVVAKSPAKPAVVDAPQAETRRGRPAQAKSGRAKKAARKAARKTAAEEGGSGAESTEKRAHGHHTVTPEGRQMMRFKRKVYWARHRASLGLEALPGDDEIIKADNEGRVLDVDKLSPKKAAATANGSRRRTVVAADVGF